MYGIAGYSLSLASGDERTLAAQSLVAGIAERGSDAAGYAYGSPALGIVVAERRGGAGGLLDAVRVPSCATQALVHVRSHTKGHPTLDRYGCGRTALEEIEGAVVTAWIDRRRPDALFLARGAGRAL